MATEIRARCRFSSFCVLFTLQSQRKLEEERKSSMIHRHAPHLQSKQDKWDNMNYRNEEQTNPEGSGWRRGGSSVHLDSLPVPTRATGVGILLGRLQGLETCSAGHSLTSRGVGSGSGALFLKALLPTPSPSQKDFS